MMHRVVGNVLLNDSGIVPRISSFDGQIGTLPREKYKKLIHVIMWRETVGMGMSNNQLINDKVNPFLSHVSSMKSWSTGSSLGFGPPFI